MARSHQSLFQETHPSAVTSLLIKRIFICYVTMLLKNKKDYLESENQNIELPHVRVCSTVIQPTPSHIHNDHQQKPWNENSVHKSPQSPKHDQVMEGTFDIKKL